MQVQCSWVAPRAPCGRLGTRAGPPFPGPAHAFAGLFTFAPPRLYSFSPPQPRPATRDEQGACALAVRLPGPLGSATPKPGGCRQPLAAAQSAQGAGRRGEAETSLEAPLTAGRASEGQDVKGQKGERRSGASQPAWPSLAPPPPVPPLLPCARPGRRMARLMTATARDQSAQPAAAAPLAAILPPPPPAAAAARC